MASFKTIAGIALMAARLSAQEPLYKFSTTVYTFGTTTASNSGFRGQIYHLKPESKKLPDFSKMKPVGSIYTPALNVPHRSFDEGFPGDTERFERVAIDYTERLWISQPGTYRFAVESGAGSALYVDGKRIIRSDGQHPVIEKAGEVKLKKGAHSIRVSYFQGPRFHVALVLRVAGPGEDEPRIFHADNFKPPADADWH